MKRILLPFIGMAVGMTAMAETYESWSLLDGPDGLTWSATTKADMINLGNEYYDDLRYNIVEVTISDASHQVKGTFTADVSGLNANDFTVFGPLTQHLFNADDQLEVGVEIHIPGNSSNDYTPQTLFRAYSLDGTQLLEVEGSGVIVSDGSNASFVLSHVVDNGMWGDTHLDVYQAAAEGIELKHSFVFDNILAEYMSGMVFSTSNLSDGIHYIISHYEKPLPLLNEYGEVDYNPETWMPYWTPDNSFVVQNYNQDFELVDEVKVPTTCPEGIMLRLMGVGIFSTQDVSEGAFTGDGRYNYVITCEDTNQYWSSEYAFEVYAEGGEHVGLLCNGVGGFWNSLSSIEGEPDQWVFLTSDAETWDQNLTIVEVPSFRKVAVLPSAIDGKLISANIDRMADAAEGYKYVIGLNEPDTDVDNNVIAQYGIYHKDFTIDHYVGLNMGSDAETFTPLVNNQSLDPHLFYADDLLEFVFLSKVKGADGMYYNTLFIGNEAGEVLNVFTGDGTTKGDIRNVAILNYGSAQPELFISYVDDNTGASTNEFLALPLGGTTGIQQVGVRNGGNKVFNLQGQRTQASVPGLYIRNGQKISIMK